MNTNNTNQPTVPGNQNADPTLQSATCPYCGVEVWIREGMITFHGLCKGGGMRLEIAMKAAGNAGAAQENPTQSASVLRRPNYRIYDRTGGGAQQDIYAESLDAAIEAGREWIEDGDWSGDQERGRYETISLDCCVREIVYYPETPGEGQTEDEDGDILDTDGYIVCANSDRGQIDEESTDDGQSWDCSGTYAPSMPDCEMRSHASNDDEPDDDGHVWVTPYELVGGLRENPGVWSKGGTRMITRSVCRLCGCHRTINDPGVQRNSDQPILTTLIDPRDTATEEWLKEEHADENRRLPEWLAESAQLIAQRDAMADVLRALVATSAAYEAGSISVDSMEEDLTSMAGRAESALAGKAPVRQSVNVQLLEALRSWLNLHDSNSNQPDEAYIPQVCENLKAARAAVAAAEAQLQENDAAMFAEQRNQPAEHHVITCDQASGEYLVFILPNGDMNFTDDVATATRYSKDEAEALARELGLGFSVESLES